MLSLAEIFSTFYWLDQRHRLSAINPFIVVTSLRNINEHHILTEKFLCWEEKTKGYVWEIVADSNMHRTGHWHCTNQLSKYWLREVGFFKVCKMAQFVQKCKDIFPIFRGGNPNLQRRLCHLSDTFHIWLLEATRFFFKICLCFYLSKNGEKV